MRVANGGAAVNALIVTAAHIFFIGVRLLVRFKNVTFVENGNAILYHRGTTIAVYFSPLSINIPTFKSKPSIPLIWIIPKIFSQSPNFFLVDSKEGGASIFYFSRQNPRRGGRRGEFFFPYRSP
jgi:hypothetical protein